MTDQLADRDLQSLIDRCIAAAKLHDDLLKELGPPFLARYGIDLGDTSCDAAQHSLFGGEAPLTLDALDVAMSNSGHPRMVFCPTCGHGHRPETSVLASSATAS